MSYKWDKRPANRFFSWDTRKKEEIMKNTKLGFTLIELLVVVLIIGILAAIALPQYTKAVEKSRLSEAQQMLGDIATAESIYYMANNHYTESLEALDLSFPNATYGTRASSLSTGVVQTPSFEIKVEGTGDSSSMTATRKGGAYDTGTLTLTLNNKGVIGKGGTFVTGSGDIPALAPQWVGAAAAADDDDE